MFLVLCINQGLEPAREYHALNRLPNKVGLHYYNRKPSKLFYVIRIPFSLD